MDEPVIAVIRPGNGGLNRVFVYDPWGSAVFERLLMAANRVCPSDAVVPPTDLPAPSWQFDASRRSP